MDLTPKSRCWRSIFSCCRPPTFSSQNFDDDAKEQEDGFHNKQFLFSTVPPLKVMTSACCKIDMGENLDTPTTACSDRSDGEALVIVFIPFTHFRCTNHVSFSNTMQSIRRDQKMILSNSRGAMSKVLIAMMLVIRTALITGMRILSMSTC